MRRRLGPLLAAWTITRMLGAEPGYWVPKDPPRAAYRATAALTPDGQLRVRTRITLRNTTSKPIQVLALDASEEAGHTLDIRCAGATLKPWRWDGSSEPSLVRLPAPLKPGATTNLDVETTRSLGRTLPEVVGLTDWIPRLHWNGCTLPERFETKATAPDGYTLLLAGRPDPATGFTLMEAAKDCGLFAAKDHLLLSRTVDGVHVRVLYPPTGADTAKACLDAAEDVIRFYRSLLGFYPHPSLDLVPGGPGPWGGNLFATAQSMIHGFPAYAKASPEFWRWITAHEIGHQYWGAHVLDGDDPAWLWIGLGTYLDHRWLEARHLTGLPRARFEQRFAEGLMAGHDTTLDLPPGLAKRLKFDRNNEVIHGKGWTLIKNLEGVMGRPAFEQAYRACLKAYAHRPLGWRDFQRACESAAGEDLSWFFEAWVRSSQAASYQITEQNCESAGAGHLTRAVITRSGPVGLPLPVVATFQDGSTQRRVLDRHDQVTRLRFVSSAPLKDLRLDPEGRFIFLPAPPPLTSEDVVEAIQDLPWTGAAAAALPWLAEAKRTRVTDPRSWFKLAMVLVDGRKLGEAGEALEALAALKPEGALRFIGLVWQGHLKDLAGDRDSALALYRQAQALGGAVQMQQTQFGFTLDQAWVAQRIERPFTF